MVSTRGVKFKFSEGERVLCYEPDPAKTKVLYNSKVLNITVGKDDNGKRLVEFLIHFQGWNSTWDRFVTEEYVLKDTEENRQLQRELAEKAQLTAGGNLYKRERKKRRRKLSERISETLESKRACDSPSTEPDPPPDVGEASDTSSSTPEEDTVRLHLSDTIKGYLEHDNKLINQDNKIIKLPCTPNVVTVLEQFFKHWAMKKVHQSSETNQATNKGDKAKNIDSIYRSMNLCKEVVDGIRIYFDFTLGEILLYRHERDQFKQIGNQSAASCFKSDGIPSTVKTELFDSDCDEKFNPEGEDGERKKSLRSSHKAASGHEHTNGSGPSSCTMPHKAQTHHDSTLSSLLSQIQQWKIVPDKNYNIQPAPPSLIYGATHLTRLFVKLPELLQTTTITEEKFEVVMEYFEYVLKFIEDHPEWFGDAHYQDNSDAQLEADH